MAPLARPPRVNLQKQAKHPIWEKSSLNCSKASGFHFIRRNSTSLMPAPSRHWGYKWTRTRPFSSCLPRNWQNRAYGAPAALKGAHNQTTSNRSGRTALLWFSELRPPSLTQYPPLTKNVFRHHLFQTHRETEAKPVFTRGNQRSEMVGQSQSEPLHRTRHLGGPVSLHLHRRKHAGRGYSLEWPYSRGGLVRPRSTTCAHKRAGGTGSSTRSGKLHLFCVAANSPVYFRLSSDCPLRAQSDFSQPRYLWYGAKGGHPIFACGLSDSSTTVTWRPAWASTVHVFYTCGGTVLWTTVYLPLALHMHCGRGCIGLWCSVCA